MPLKQAVEETVQTTTDYTLRADSLLIEFTWLSGLKLHFNNAAVQYKYGKSADPALLRTPTLTLALRYLPLLLGQPKEVQHIQIERGRLYLNTAYRYTLPPPSKELSLKDTNFELRHYRLVLQNRANHLVIRGQQLLLQHLEAREPLLISLVKHRMRLKQANDETTRSVFDRLYLSSRVRLPQHTEPYPQDLPHLLKELDLSAKHVHLKELLFIQAHFIEPLLHPHKPVSWRTQMTGELHEVKVRYRPNALSQSWLGCLPGLIGQPSQISISIRTKKPLNYALSSSTVWKIPPARIELNGEPNYLKRHTTLNRLRGKIQSQWLNLDITGHTVFSWSQKAFSNTKLRLTSKPIAVSWIQQLPKEWLPTPAQRILKTLYAGNIQIKQIDLTQQKNQFRLTGRIHFQQLVTNVIRDFTGEVKFTPNFIGFQNLQGKLNGNPFALTGSLTRKTTTKWLFAFGLLKGKLPVDGIQKVILNVTEALSPTTTPPFVKRTRWYGTLHAKEFFVKGSVNTVKTKGLTAPIVRIHTITGTARLAPLKLYTLQGQPLLHLTGTFTGRNQQLVATPLTLYLERHAPIPLKGAYNFDTDQLHGSMPPTSIQAEALQTVFERWMSILNGKPYQITVQHPLRLQGNLRVGGNIHGNWQQPNSYRMQVAFQNVSIQQLLPKGNPFTLAQQVTGQLNLKNSLLSLTQLKGYLSNRQTSFSAEGKAQLAAIGSKEPFSSYQGNLTSNQIALEQFLPTIKQSIKDPQSIVHSVDTLSGTGSLSLQIEGQHLQNPSINGQLTLTQLKSKFKNHPEWLTANTMQFVLNRNQLELKPTELYLGTTPLQLTSKIQLEPFLQGKAPIYDIDLRTEALALETIQKNQALLETITRIHLPELWHTEGMVNAQLSLHQTTKQTQPSISGELHFNQAGLSWEGGDFPLYNMNGSVAVESNTGEHPIQLKFNQPFDLMYGTSPVKIQAGSTIQINPNQQGQLHLGLSGTLAPLELSHHVRVSGRGQRSLLGVSLPFTLTTDMQVNRLDQWLNGTTMNLAGKVFWQPDTVAETATDPIELKAAVALSNGMFRLQDSELKLGNAGVLSVQGVIGTGIEGLTPTLGVHSILKSKSPLDLIKLSQLFAFSNEYVADSGSLAIDLTLKGIGELNQPFHETLTDILETTNLKCSLQIDNLSLPQLSINQLSTLINFDGKEGHINLTPLNISATSLSASGDIKSVWPLPIKLENVAIAGEMLNIDALNQFTQDTLIKKVTLPIQDRFGIKDSDILIPLEFHNASVLFQEAIFRNIILENATGGLSVYSNGFVDINDLVLNVAGGSVTGKISVNPVENQFLSINLAIQSVKANAMARALLNAPNQVFGDLNGSVQVSTFGHTDAEMNQNVSGLAKISITDGRLPAIARIETLLTAANVIRGGLLGLNVNNLIRTVSPFQNNYFATLAGDFHIANGYVYTDNLTSNGENLDLTIQGNVALSNGYSNLTILGAMAQDVEGTFGAVGKLSMRRLFRFIPGVGYIPGSEKGLVDYIPGVGWVPGFGGAAEGTNRFKVRIVGPLEDTASTQSLEWMKE